MAANNLRIIYQNVVDMAGTTITASTVANATTTPVSNTQQDLKSKVWRTATSPSTTVYGTVIITNTTAIAISGLILAFTNLSQQATITVRGYTGTVPTVSSPASNTQPVVTTTGATLQFSTGAVLAAPYQGLGEWNWGTNPNSAQGYSNTRVYARAWMDAISATKLCTSFVVEIFDPSQPDQFIEVSRIILGKAWSPKYNTSYGITSQINDLSSNTRTEAGDLVSFAAPYYNSVSLDLQYMDKVDRSELFKIVRSIGVRRPLFVSIFPDNSEDWGKEQVFQCYGKFVQVPGITHSMYETYAAQLEIEEI